MKYKNLVDFVTHQLTMSSSHVIVKGGHIDKEMVAFFAAIHFHRCSDVHARVHLERECTLEFLVAHIAIVINVLLLMRRVVAFCAEA